LTNLGSELEKCVGSRVHLVGVSIPFEKNFYRLPFTPPLSDSPYRSFSTAASNPDRRSEVGSIQRARLASLGSMDPQTSDQPTLRNDQHSSYTKEHAPECKTRGTRAGRTKGSGLTSLTQRTDPQPPSNRLRDQITDAQSKAVKIIGPTAPGDTTVPPCRLL
jgi:hypothetical protein